MTQKFFSQNTKKCDKWHGTARHNGGIVYPSSHGVFFMTDDLKRIEKSGSESIAALRSILTALEITNLVREKKLEINPLMGQPVVIETLETNHRGGISQHFLRVTALSMEVLQGKMKALRTSPLKHSV
jgi:hypothetical protein